MSRAALLCIVLGAIWLAHTAVPQAEVQRQLERAVGINVSSDPDARALNAASSVDNSTTGSYRSAAEVFGQGASQTERKSDTVLIATIASMPAPDRNPRHISERTIGNGAPASDVEVATRRLVATQATAAFMTVSTIAPLEEPLSRKTTESGTGSAQSAEPQNGVMSQQERRRIARLIQRELKRVGCYSGAINGVWDRKSRVALEAFAKQISSAVPLAKPDYVALMLVESYDVSACRQNSGATITVASRRAVSPTSKSRSLKAQLATADFVARTSPSVPTASPLRTRRQRTARVPIPSRGDRLLRTARLGPRVAGISIRKTTVQTGDIAGTSHKLSSRKSDAGTSRRAQSAAKSKRIAAARRARRAARVRAARARQKRLARRRVARRNATNRTAGFSRPGRAWVRRAFTARR